MDNECAECGAKMCGYVMTWDETREKLCCFCFEEDDLFDMVCEQSDMQAYSLCELTEEYVRIKREEDAVAVVRFIDKNFPNPTTESARALYFKYVRIRRAVNDERNEKVKNKNHKSHVKLLLHFIPGLAPDDAEKFTDLLQGEVDMSMIEGNQSLAFLYWLRDSLKY